MPSDTSLTLTVVGKKSNMFKIKYGVFLHFFSLFKKDKEPNKTDGSQLRGVLGFKFGKCPHSQKCLWFSNCLFDDNDGEDLSTQKNLNMLAISNTSYSKRKKKMTES